MIVGVDGNEANVPKKVGVSVYTLNLLKYFKKKSNKSLRFKIFLKDSPKNLPEEGPYFRYEVVHGRFLWSQIFLPLRLYFKKDIDIFFSPAHYLPRFCPVPSVVTIHDLSYINYPKDFLKKDLFQLKNWTKYSVKQARKIIAVSKTTKKDVMKNYQVPDDKVVVVYNGGVSTSYTLTPSLKDNNVNNPYLLYVGTLQPRKNITTLILAFNEIKKIFPEFKLTIAGKKGWLFNEIFKLIDELGLETDVYFTDYVTDNQLSYLYKNAFCFVLPSFYEGFGIPVLEAMSFDCPVIASFSSSLPEIGGDACLYFDPKNPLNLVEKIKTLIENNKLRSDLIKKGRARVRQFSWDKCGEETLKIILTNNASSTVS
ncbi:hypothetical protein B6D29_01380 [Microgenomates bacterium UTCPR1]|nr:glycosyltransferase family 4 protein [Patescibacteria group bacterium]OQY68036.1 MAG: hypothetical protein B6D29_01380 [Microgenomates bacterium UTCPR1]